MSDPTLQAFWEASCPAFCRSAKPAGLRELRAREGQHELPSCPATHSGLVFHFSGVLLLTYK